jgi:hypothetical protein
VEPPQKGEWILRTAIKMGCRGNRFNFGDFRGNIAADPGAPSISRKA